MLKPTEESGKRKHGGGGDSRCPLSSANLLSASLDGAVLAGHVLAVPVVCSAAGQAQVGVALPHGQVAGALLGVALGFAPTAWEAVLTCGGGEGWTLALPGSWRVCGGGLLDLCSYTLSYTGRTSRRSSGR